MIRQLSRALMAGVFIHQGVEALRRPADTAEATGAVAVALADRLPVLPSGRPEVLVRANGAAQLTGGANPFDSVPAGCLGDLLLP